MANLNHYFENRPVEIKANMLFWIKAGEGEYTELSDVHVKFDGELDVNAMGQKIQGPFTMELKLNENAEQGSCTVAIQFQKYDITDEQASYTATDSLLTVKAQYKGRDINVSFMKESASTVIKGDILPVTVKLDPK